MLLSSQQAWNSKASSTTNVFSTTPTPIACSVAFMVASEVNCKGGVRVHVHVHTLCRNLFKVNNGGNPCVVSPNVGVPIVGGVINSCAIGKSVDVYPKRGM
jgi:hypothetical protein